MVYLLLILGFILLLKGADFFVSGSSAIARRFHVSPLVIGLTIVAFGTSAPEAAVSITASVTGSNDLAVANIIGSNIFNLMPIIGICAMMRPMPIQKTVLAKEFPFSVIAAICILVFSLDNTLGSGGPSILTHAEGIVLLIFFGIFMFSLLYFSKKGDAGEDDTIPENLPSSTIKIILFTFGGLAAIVLGGQLTVNSCVEIARMFGLSENLIGLTVAAIGTSLPELVTSITAIRKGENNIALGNVIGSNIFNIFFILGASATISPLSINTFAIYDIAILIGFSLITYIFAMTKKTISRSEGMIMVLLYIGYMVYIIMR